MGLTGILLHILLVCTPYVTKVWEYCPAPGQFVNEVPEYEEGDNAQTMCTKVESLICGTTNTAVSLGGWGGYIVVGFDHMIMNVEGEYDFRIWGNTFYADPNNPEAGGSSEPGVVSVSYDLNGNGLPDDAWYELAGSEYFESTHNYQITYFKTPAGHTRTPKPSEELVDTTYILWRDINGQRGYIEQNRYHLQNYFPLWVTADKLVFRGTLLPDNAVSYYAQGHTQYLMYSFEYGYADNHPNNTEGSKMKIDWAVDRDGFPANLPGIHFVKIQTGVNRQCGWIGELSTEVSGAEDLHPASQPTDVVTVNGERLELSGARKVWCNGHLYIIVNQQIKYIL